MFVCMIVFDVFVVMIVWMNGVCRTFSRATFRAFYIATRVDL